MKAIFKVITPIFIGSGEDYYPQDYFILDDEIFFIDETKFFEKLKRENKLEKFLEVSENIYDLLDFIDDNADEKIAKAKIKADSEVVDDLLNTISRPLSAFIKDKFLFAPYIPGSTIKGAIRSALLDYCVKTYKEEIENILRRLNKRLDRVNAKELETIVFCNANLNRRNQLQFDPTKDILKALYVNDFKPKNYSLKAISPKNKTYRGELNEIPVVVESLIDGEFEGEIRVDRDFINRDKSLRENRFLSNLSMDLIKNALKEFFEDITDIENKRFRVTPIKYEEFNIKIGKFAGAGSKSISDLRKIDIRQIGKTFNYQLSVWIYEDMPLGWGRLVFKDKGC